MESYITLTKNINKIKGNNKLETVLAIAGIKFIGNYTTHMTETTREWIAEKTGITFRTVKSITSNLQTNAGFIFNKIETKTKCPNKYYFKDDKEDFFFIRNTFFSEDIDTKIKGLLLLIKSVCKKETNKYISESPYLGGLNHTELSKKLGIDAKTSNKYLEIAINAKQIKLIDKGLLITNKSIIPDFIKNDLYTRIYHIVYNWCIDNDIIPPNRNDEITVMEDGTVKRRNRLLTEIVGKLGNKSDEEIKCLLTNRITSKPKEITLEYIAKVLNIENTKTEIQCSIMVD